MALIEFRILRACLAHFGNSKNHRFFYRGEKDVKAQ